MWASIAVSLARSSSWAAVTVTVCAVDQLPVVNVNTAGLTVTPLPPGGAIDTVTAALGWAVSFTV